MTKILPQTAQAPLILHLRPVIDLTEDQFFEFCRLNQDLRIERTDEGELVIIPLTSSCPTAPCALPMPRG